KLLRLLNMCIRDIRWFSGYTRLLIERPIVISTAETRRPDRVVWTADGHIDIIDFKSGSQPAKKYRRQLVEYVTLLSGLGYRKLRAYLYYLDSGEIIEIPV
ncbi:MAG: PD-(D/E)XK nuclease family protein, partial [Duncaniella sp.]|uniref:PD-(D/E)XK nuclease family protein n=1 Tax=Duncaniella sp. TaxID=2518496 RepID=UPI0023CCEED8